MLFSQEIYDRVASFIIYLTVAIVFAIVIMSFILGTGR